MNQQRPGWRFRAIGLNSRNANKLHSLFWLVSVIGWGACRTVPPFPRANLSDPGWTIREGQAVWRRNSQAPEIAGDLLVATHRHGETFLQFTKPPLPFVVARITTNRWHIEFVTERRQFSGRGEPPSRLGWLHLARCVSGSIPPAKWHWVKLPDDRWRLENPSSGETFEGFLTR
jgi:hypothetical protein